MKQVKLRLWNNRENCTRTIRNGVNRPTWKLHNSMICAAPDRDRDSKDSSALCKGDGGGPLVCKQSGSGSR